MEFVFKKDDAYPYVITDATGDEIETQFKTAELTNVPLTKTVEVDVLSIETQFLRITPKPEALEKLRKHGRRSFPLPFDYNIELTNAHGEPVQTADIMSLKIEMKPNSVIVATVELGI